MLHQPDLLEAGDKSIAPRERTQVEQNSKSVTASAKQQKRDRKLKTAKA